MKAALGTLITASIGLIILIADGLYIVEEGHIGVVSRWGEAVSQEEPSGLSVKMPIATRIEEFDVREQRMEETLTAATANQLPITAVVTMNWRPDPTQMLEVKRNYGSPEAFASTILAPRLRQASKSGLSQYQASDLIRERQAAATEIQTRMTRAMETYPASVLSIQIEDVALPERYREAVLAKEEAREGAAREEYNLQRQKLEAQREVQTAEAQRDAAKAKADGNAYSVRVEAEAEADAIRMRGEAEAQAIDVMQEALAENPLIVDFERARRWNGQMPQTVLGDDTGVLFSNALR